MKTHSELLRECYAFAERSGDLSTKNAAMLIDDEGLFSYGVNDLPRGCESTQERRARPLKYQYTEHAERAAIFDAARNGVSTKGKTMVCCWAACTDCARAIALSGIETLVRHRLPIHESRPDWNASIVVADEILRECGVEIVDVREEVGARMFFDGKWVDV